MNRKKTETQNDRWLGHIKKSEWQILQNDMTDALITSQLIMTNELKKETPNDNVSKLRTTSDLKKVKNSEWHTAESVPQDLRRGAGRNQENKQMVKVQLICETRWKFINIIEETLIDICESLISQLFHVYCNTSPSPCALCMKRINLASSLRSNSCQDLSMSLRKLATASLPCLQWLFCHFFWLRLKRGRHKSTRVIWNHDLRSEQTKSSPWKMVVWVEPEPGVVATCRGFHVQVKNSSNQVAQQ